MSAAAVAGMIGLYQRWLSPLKGFVCAHRRERGGCSCSEFGRRVVLRFGVLRFIPLMRQRFARCAAAAKALAERRKKKRQSACAVRESERGGKVADCVNAIDCGPPGDCADVSECACTGTEFLPDFL